MLASRLLTMRFDRYGKIDTTLQTAIMYDRK
ncbi:hypothetical protein BWQ96_04295 [Gracilariopsis chorda]|uniref:Uncharacterized protein n=1 Tax=Gracilariopsis chorda TaxID=448386 RepID=A0A2V3IUZ0_9FLOR|nr:hypothetical protein BWQ96_04295 [Gracilariopsis chorda]|eukprot:PXF45934.1 hypothetical protein BWQ96_04295 [Gracilariopsis chorda]